MFKKKKKMGDDALIIMSTGEKIFNVFNMIFLSILGLICFYPLVYVFVSSISKGTLVDAGMVLIIPKEITFSAYKQIMTESQFFISYANTLYYTVFGSIFSMVVSAPAAYVLSKKRFRARKTINMLLAFTMWFVPGFIPLFLNYKSLGAIDNRVMIVISFGVQAFYIILLRNYFESIPAEMEESAMIDGATDFTSFFKIYLPLSKASLATVWLYYAMSRWNGYFWASTLLRDFKKIPLQVYLKQKIIDKALIAQESANIAGQDYSYTTLIYALVICSVVPILCIYPFIQKYFAKGVMVGGVKG